MPELVHSHLNFPDDGQDSPAGAMKARAERAGTRRGRVRGSSAAARSGGATRGPDGHSLRLRHGPAAATRAHGK